MSEISVGIAPIGWTNDDMPALGGEISYGQILSEVALSGFQGTEIGNKYPKDPQILNRELKLRGIRIAAAWFGVYLTTESYETEEARFIAFADYMAALDADCINIAEQGHSIQGQRDKAILFDKPTFTDDEWDRLTTGLNRLGEIANSKGLRLCYHHHMGTGVESAEEIDKLMARTDPQALKLLFDVGHLKLAGEAPEAVVKKYYDRIGHVHLKDVREDIIVKVREDRLSFLDAILSGVFTVPGDGETDFARLLSPVLDSDYKGWFMVEAEQDPGVANPLEYAQTARAYLHSQLGI